MDSETSGRESLCVCECLDPRGAGGRQAGGRRGGVFASISHLSPRRSPSERGHGHRSGQHRPHLRSQHGKVFIINPPPHHPAVRSVMP